MSADAHDLCRGYREDIETYSRDICGAETSHVLACYTNVESILDVMLDDGETTANTRICGDFCIYNKPRLLREKDRIAESRRRLTACRQDGYKEEIHASLGGAMPLILLCYLSQM